MKKIFFLLVIAALVLTQASCTGYEPGVSEAFAKYRFKDGVTTVSVPGWVINLGAKFGDLDNDEREILESIDKVKVLAVDDKDLNAKINLHKEFYERINKQGEYDELMVVRDGDEEVTIFGKMNDDVISEMVVLVGGDDNVLIYLKGDFRPELLDDKIDLTNPDKFLSFKN